MVFATGALNDPAKVEGGELIGSNDHAIIPITDYEDGLRVGRFAKLDTGRVDNFDGSATPTVAGLVKRKISNAVEDANVLKLAQWSSIDIIRGGFATVDVKDGESPSFLSRVYISNAGDADDGLATANAADVDANAEFIREVKTGTWVIYITPAPGDLAAHIANPTNAHAASAISIVDAGGFTATTEVEGALQEMYPYITEVVADPGNAGALPVARTSVVAITTAGAETRTVADPTTAGITLTVSHDVDGGDCVITFATAFNEAGNNIITINDPGNAFVVTAVQVGGSLVWRLVVNDGGVLS